MYIILLLRIPEFCGFYSNFKSITTKLKKNVLKQFFIYKSFLPRLKFIVPRL